MKKVIAVLIAAAALSGCSAYTKGSFQSLTVSSTPSNAVCEISYAGEGKVFAALATDDTVYNIRRGSKVLSILCSKEGYYDAQAMLSPETDEASYASFVIPDLLIGTNFVYPSDIHIILRKI